MPWSSLARSPVTTAIPANKKFVTWMPKVWLTGKGWPKPPAPGVTLPVNNELPVVSASSLSVAGGGTASVTDGIWDNATAPFTYQWMGGASVIAGATTNSYKFVAADETYNITCVVTATNVNGSTPATSNAVGPVTA